MMLETTLMGLAGILPYLAVAFVLWMIYKLIHDHLTYYDDASELSRGNVAAGLVRGGAYCGVALAASGSLVGSEEPFLEDLKMFAIDGVVAVVVFTAACFVLDAIILRKIKNEYQIARGNMAVAVLEASSYIGLGIIMNASFSGGGQKLLPGLGSAVLFSVLGLLTLALIYLAFEFLHNRLKKCKVEHEVEHGNVAVAVEAGGVVLGMSIALWFSISGDFVGWREDVTSYAIAALSSIVAVGLAWFISGRRLSGIKHTVSVGSHHGNVATAVIRMMALLSAGFIAGLVTFV